MRAWLSGAVIAGLLAAAGAATAQTWPAKPVKFVVAYAPGSAPDIASRIVGEGMSRGLGQQVLVENRPGAGNVIAAQVVAHAPADGYTLFFTAAAALVTNSFTFKSLPYDPERDFTPIGLVGRTTFMILLNPDVPATTLAELIALDKAHPGTLSFASDGPKNLSGMLGEWLNKLAGLHLVQVPYAVMPQGIQDTITGRIQIAMLTMTVATPLVQDGRLRAIAVSTAKPVPGFENVPPVAETFPGFDFGGWYGVVAPAATPPAVVQRLNRELNVALTDPAIRRKLQDGGLLTEGADTPAEFGVFLREDRARWADVIREIGIEPE